MDNLTPPESAQPAATEAPTLSKEALSKWWARIEASEQIITTRKKEWEKNIAAYMGKVLDALPKDHFVNVPLEFAYVELKKAQLAFQVPEVHLKPERPGLERAVPVFQAAVNHELGPDAADAKTTIDEAMTDVLTCGIAFTKVGYDCDLRTRQVPVMQPAPPDPATGQPPAGQNGQPAMVPAMRPSFHPETQQMLLDPATGQPQMEPQMQDEQYCAHENYFWSRFPVEHGLVPSDFEQSNFDRAPWLGMKFFPDLESAKKDYKLPDTFASTVSSPRETLSSSEGPDRGQPSYQQVEGYEIWYETRLFDEDSDALPGQYTKLVLIKGLKDRPAAWQPSPYQFIGEDGKLHGMKGNPIHPLTLRFLPGSAYPVGDVSIARPLSKELSTGRTQQIQFRDRALPMRLLRRDAIDVEVRDKIVDGEIMANIAVDGNPNEVAAMLALPQMPRETTTTNDMVMHDFQRTWAVGATPGGVVEPEARTATEVNNAQGTADVRLDAERTRILNWFCKAARKFGALLQQFKDTPGYAEIVGDDGVKALQAWDMKAIQGEFAFRAKPDSALRIDADVEKRQSLSLYNLLGKDPNVNRVELLKTVLLRHNIDPTKIVVPTPPPAPHPEPPKVSLSFKGEDMGNPMVLAILQQLGIQLPTPQELAGMPSEPAQPGQAGPPGMMPPPGAGGPGGGAPPGMAPHPGAVPQAEPLSKHSLDQTAGKLM